MGYYVQQKDVDFFIPKENFAAALAAIKALKGQETIEDSSGRHFSWVTPAFDLNTTLEGALRDWRWGAEIDEGGNVFDITFRGEKLGDDELLFRAIGPFVRAGSVIEMQGEDGLVWKWAFDGTACSTYYGRVVFDDEPDPVGDELVRLANEVDYVPRDRSGWEQLLSNPEWEKASRVSDWRNYVEIDLTKVWDRLSFETRIVIYINAFRETKREVWK